MPLTEANKEKKKQYNKEYREANKEKIKEYREANKEKMKEYKKDYRENNKDKIKEYKKEYDKHYRENNKEYIKEYNKTETCKKSKRISGWKKSGVISDDYDKLYEMYINVKNCEKCNIELVEGLYGNNKRVLDHCHKTGQFRNILCHTCNIRRG